MTSANVWAPEGSCCTSTEGSVYALNAFILENTQGGQLIETTYTSAVTVTLPTEAADPSILPGFTISGFHHGAGLITFSYPGITLKYPAGFLANIGTNSPWTLIKSRVAADTWLLYGFLVTA